MILILNQDGTVEYDVSEEFSKAFRELELEEAVEHVTDEELVEALRNSPWERRA